MGIEEVYYNTATVSRAETFTNLDALYTRIKLEIPQDRYLLGFRFIWYVNYDANNGTYTKKIGPSFYDWTDTGNQSLSTDGSFEVDTWYYNNATAIEGWNLDPGDTLTAGVTVYTVKLDNLYAYNPYAAFGGEDYTYYFYSDDDPFVLGSSPQVWEWYSKEIYKKVSDYGLTKWYDDSATSSYAEYVASNNLMTVLNSMITAYGSNTGSRRQVDLSTTLTVEPPDDIKRVESDCSAEAADTADVSETATSVKVYQVFTPLALPYLNEALTLVYTPNPASDSGILFYSQLNTVTHWESQIATKIANNIAEAAGNDDYDLDTDSGGYDWSYNADANVVLFGNIDELYINTTSRNVVLVYYTTDSAAVNAIGGSTWNSTDEQLEPAAMPMVPLS